jgi:hypothetical protein
MSHAFPSLNDDSNCRSGRSDDSCNVFKPLFQDMGRPDTASPHCGLGITLADGNLDAENKIRQDGFQQGFEAGGSDACSLARQELVPEIKAFADAFNQLNEGLIRIERKSSQKILETAISISEKILGSAPGVTAEVLSSLKNELKNHMIKSYRIQLMLHCKDMDLLSELMQCENPRWQVCDYIKLAGGTQIQSGSLEARPAGQTMSSNETLHALDLSLENILAQVSTK